MGPLEVCDLRKMNSRIYALATAESGMPRRIKFSRQRLADVSIEPNFPGGDFAKGETGRLVLGRVDDRSRARHELPRSLCPEEHEREAVVDQRKAIFNGDAGHGAPCA